MTLGGAPLFQGRWASVWETLLAQSLAPRCFCFGRIRRKVNADSLTFLGLGVPLNVAEYGFEPL